jgi:endonuclease/exonuclease/phosphatase family metal-dependent hydrolase
VRLISWNIQWCRGIDGRVDPARIAAEVKRLGDADIICLQEVADNYASLAGSEGENQVEALARELPGRELAWGFAVDVADGEAARRRFGNLIVSRLPLRRVLRHSLPWPADPSVPSMPRIAVEAAIEAPFGLLRVTNTHLEYYSPLQRAAQVERLRELHAEACAHARAPAAREKYGPVEPEPRPASAVLCGDFNMAPDDPLHARLCAPFDDGTPRLVDCWRQVHLDAPHPPTFKLHERDPGEAPYCCDYIFASEDLAPRIKSIRVDARTQASDHQPVIVEFAD